ncbi:hypothetical protein PENTCL1PPCAC_14702, partial [Pristionchus entomophagus]
QGAITVLNLTDTSRSLGLDQEQLDNFALIGKDLIQKQANGVLAKGIPVHISQSPAQPATFYNLKIDITEHGLYVAVDLTISPALVGTLSYAGSCYRF